MDLGEVKMKMETKLKINELIDYPKSIYARSSVLKILEKYIDKEVITSYIKNDFGVVFIIKGKIKAFAFACIRRDLCSSYYNIEQLNINKYFKLRNEINNKDTITILDEETEKSIQAKCMLNELETGNK